MLAIFRHLWKFRAEIILAVQLVSALRKSAKELAQEYIRRRIHEKLKRQLAIVGTEVTLILFSVLLVQEYRGLGVRCFASLTLWGITLYNFLELSLVTIPELHSVHQHLKGKTGYALKYFLGVSVVTELMQLNTVFLSICVFFGISTRTFVGSSLSYIEPWQTLLRRFW